MVDWGGARKSSPSRRPKAFKLRSCPTTRMPSTEDLQLQQSTTQSKSGKATYTPALSCIFSSCPSWNVWSTSISAHNPTPYQQRYLPGPHGYGPSGTPNMQMAPYPFGHLCTSAHASSYSTNTGYSVRSPQSPFHYHQRQVRRLKMIFSSNFLARMVVQYLSPNTLF